MDMREVSAEKFAEWYPNNPEEVLRAFMVSKKVVMNVAFKVKVKTVIVANISPEHAERLLEEFRVMREEDEQD